jgi:hypothetical protein
MGAHPFSEGDTVTIFILHWCAESDILSMKIEKTP